MKRTYRKLLFGLVLATTPLALAADRERLNKLGNEFVCVCGTCNQLLMACNHVGCPSSQPMKAELAEEIDSGKDDRSIVSAFIEKYGITVLSSPPRSGFNLAAWIVPFAALAAGALMLVFFVRRFRSKWTMAPAAADADMTKYQRKVEEELEKYTPED